MSDQNRSASYVRTEMLPEQAPPVTAAGPIKWVRENLFSNVLNSILSLLSIYVIFWAISNLIPWVFGGVWDAGSLTECRTVLAAFAQGESACWAVIEDRWLQLMFGFYPADQYWRPVLAVVLMLVALAPILFSQFVPAKLIWFSVLYPFIAVWLIWGGSFWSPILVLMGFVVGFAAFALASRFTIGGIAVGIAVIASYLWWSAAIPIVNGGINRLVGEPRFETRLADAESRLAALPDEIAEADAAREAQQDAISALIEERDAVAVGALATQAEIKLEELAPELAELQQARAAIEDEGAREAVVLDREIAQIEAEMAEAEADLAAAGDTPPGRDELEGLQTQLLAYQDELAVMRDELFALNAAETALTEEQSETRLALRDYNDLAAARDNLDELRAAASSTSAALPSSLRGLTSVNEAPSDLSESDEELLRANIAAQSALTEAREDIAQGYERLALTGLETVESREIGGFLVAVIIGMAGIILSFPLGIALALGRQSDLLIIKMFCVAFIETIRGVPLIVWLFTAQLLLNYFLPPGSNFDLLLRVVIMVTFFASAYIAEVIRGGLAALPRGQYEGADSLGLDYWQSMRLIILPQALKISIPGIVNTFIGLFKDTTLVVFIGIFDTIGLTNAIRADTDWNGIYWELFIFVGACFFICCFSMSKYSQYLERTLRTDHR